MEPRSPDQEPGEAATRFEDKKERTVSRPAPTWVLILFTFVVPILAILFWMASAEERSLSAEVQGELLPGGKDVEVTRSDTSDRHDCDGQVAYTVKGQEYVMDEQVPGVRCPKGDEGVEVTVRYNPDNPRSFDTDSEDWGVYLFLVCSVLGGLAVVISWGFRIRSLLGAKRS